MAQKVPSIHSFNILGFWPHGQFICFSPDARLIFSYDGKFIDSFDTFFNCGIQTSFPEEFGTNGKILAASCVDEYHHLLLCRINSRIVLKHVELDFENKGIKMLDELCFEWEVFEECDFQIVDSYPHFALFVTCRHSRQIFYRLFDMNKFGKLCVKDLKTDGSSIKSTLQSFKQIDFQFEGKQLMPHLIQDKIAFVEVIGDQLITYSATIWILDTNKESLEHRCMLEKNVAVPAKIQCSWFEDSLLYFWNPIEEDRCPEKIHSILYNVTKNESKNIEISNAWWNSKESFSEVDLSTTQYGFMCQVQKRKVLRQPIKKPDTLQTLSLMKLKQKFYGRPFPIDQQFIENSPLSPKFKVNYIRVKNSITGKWQCLI